MIARHASNELNLYLDFLDSLGSHCFVVKQYQVIEAVLDFIYMISLGQIENLVAENS